MRILVPMARQLTEGQRAAIRAAIARRGERGMTQQDLAKAAGVSLRTVTSFEGGHSWPTARTLGQLERLGLNWPVGHIHEVADTFDESHRSPRSDGRGRIRELVNELEDHLLSGNIQWAEATFARAVSASRAMTEQQHVVPLSRAADTKRRREEELRRMPHAADDPADDDDF